MSGPRPSYTVVRVGDFGFGDPGERPWERIPPLAVDHYRWLENGYAPRVEARVGWSPRFLYVRFAVGEKRVRVRYMKFQDPVYKDTCVEFFVDMFPEKRLGYVNFETNAAGTLLAAFGPDRSRRTPLWPEELAGFAAEGSIRGPVTGEYGASEWTLEYRVPLALFKNLYGEEVRPGRRAAANFYKCGDETEVPHYGAWSPVETPAPDFHRPEFFGELVFG
ncbi:MAG TPA: carbohydrate-binding family 9-like protein [Acidobacteriota bacterium]|nr:carbohydrate-binding family 9-like protein [Acidobacteriota bacterium]